MWENQKDAQADESYPAQVETPASNRAETILGPSVAIKGELSAREDLRLEGSVEGSIVLESNALTIGDKGQVDGDLDAREARVEGRLTGNASAGERVIVASSGRVTGDLSAPRVVLEDGCSFSGRIDTEQQSSSSSAVKATA